jgi:hypothetical protein
MACTWPGRKVPVLPRGCAGALRSIAVPDAWFDRVVLEPRIGRSAYPQFPGHTRGSTVSWKRCATHRSTTDTSPLRSATRPSGSWYEAMQERSFADHLFWLVAITVLRCR